MMRTVQACEAVRRQHNPRC